MNQGPAPPLSPWPVSLWLLATLSFVALSASVATRLLSTSLILDLAALWPLAAVALVLIPVGLWRAGAKTAAPAMFLVWMFAGFGLHLAFPQMLPSSAGDAVSGVIGDDVAIAEIGFNEIDRLELGFAAQSDLVEITMLRAGGSAPPPAITPVIGSGRAEVAVSPREDPGYFLFKGWDASLDIGPEWTVSVVSPDMTIDTSGATRLGLIATGTGTIHLDSIPNESEVELAGIFTVVVPRGLGVEVLGPADVPPDWAATTQGAVVEDAVLKWLVIVGEGSRVTVSYEGA